MRAQRPRSTLTLLGTLTTAAALALGTAGPATAAERPVPVRHAAAAHGLTSDLTPVTGLLAQRLLLADKVAAAKYGTDTPIDDPEREARILDDVRTRAAGLGLDPDAVAAVFRDQIEANKLVQRGLYARWDANPGERPTERPDLAKEVRPALDRITTQLLAALDGTERARALPSCGPRLATAAGWSAYTHRLDALHLKGLGRALPSVCAAP
ncbi:chorismate mutase [Streptomyces coeruleorubidus]|uniref:chorismate mutase n=1 Tax=Streptomyces coeruleorubidus TaxID=116188 RepID=A0ABZ0KK92_STRC4|nr:MULTISPECIES: chorismate mutase [Streptomyces]WOT38472.1 chorismate mutase [Streptomyces coeruleorubidus]GGT98232.1 chorismate mutase [Streptomyces bellus]